jgi:hypothetical protein
MNKPANPYKKYEAEPIWAIIERAIRDLSRNGDIQEETDRRYIVGFLCKQILEAKSTGKTRTNRNGMARRVVPALHGAAPSQKW